MKFYVHIGTEKTGTTTLQKFLHFNRFKLIEAGYAYTISADVANNRLLPMTAYPLNRRDEETRLRGIISDVELAKFQKKTIKALQAEIASLACPGVIFSSEHIQSRLKGEGGVSRLKKYSSTLALMK
jgi:hypothetical protein